MKYNIVKWLGIALGSLLLQTAFTQVNEIWPQVKKETHPWTRWWWMSSAVDEKNIDLQLNTFSKADFGGVEIVPIYGAIGYESKYISYLSPHWMKTLDYTVKQANSLNMGVDISVGTGWPIGGPQVSTIDAATKLKVQTYSLNAHQSLNEKIIINGPRQKGWPGVGLSALMAYGDKGEVLELTDKVKPDGTLAWSPSEGKWQLYAAFVAKTGQAVKRAALGGEGYTLDHFSKTSISNYFKTFDTAFGETSHGVRSFFNDSYEVFNADWTPDFFSEFQQRRGYDLKPFLKSLVSKDKTDEVARLKSDYRETMSDLMLQNFTQTFTQWAHSKKAMNTNQAHGSPGNLLDLYGAVDIPECETFGSSHFDIPGIRRDPGDVRNVDPDPNMLKFASSAAHTLGKPYASCETFTWLTEHFKTSWSQCKPEVEQAFLSGINHVFYHGTTYSPADAPWPGWLFYASVNFVPNNSLWLHLKGLNDYITRCQSVLQAGKPDNEVMIYWPVYEAWNNPEGMDMAFKVHDIDVWMYPTEFYKNLVKLQSKGYSLDFVSDRMLQQTTVTKGILKANAAGAEYKVLLISKSKFMPVATFQQIIQLAKNGATVVIQQMPEDVPGLKDLKERRLELQKIVNSLSFKKDNNTVSECIVGNGKIILSANVQNGLEYAGIERETLVDSGLKFIRRKVSDGKYYYIVNHTDKTYNGSLPVNFKGASTVILDPQTGESGLAAATFNKNTENVRLQLVPGQAVIVKVTQDKLSLPNWKYEEMTGPAISLNSNEWTVHFTQGGPVLPSDQKIKSLQNWTMFDDPSTQSFSGTAEYTTTFKLNNKNAVDYLLQLGKVNESAKVWINGKEVGILWSIPFEARIGKYLKAGENTIKIEVANLMANRIRDMDRKGIQWRKYHEINFVNVNYKEFDASKWDVMPSGLEGVVTITPMKITLN